ncbi:helix-turn-helix domain-containing protein [Terribacillus saccharophilus]|uniref:helix-turn-helix domain-containing protein n=1 Tax=Terribacillus saccharophilus TaxID=361277 RepID=UPI003981B8E5
MDIKDSLEKLNTEFDEYLSGRQAANLLDGLLGDFNAKLITSYCRKGLLEGSKIIDDIWQIPKVTLHQILSKKRLIEVNYFTFSQLSERLGVTESPIKLLVKKNIIQKEEITILASKRSYILKNQKSVSHLLELRERINTGIYITRAEAAEKFGVKNYLIPNLDSKLSDSDKFLFIDKIYINKFALEKVLKAKKNSTAKTIVSDDLDKQFKNVITNNKQYITVKQASKLLDKSPATVQNWCKNGTIKDFYRLDSDSALMISYEELRQSLKNNREFKEFYMSAKEFSKEVGLSVGIIYSKIELGRIPDFIKIDKSWFIPKNRVPHYVQNFEWRQRTPRTLEKPDEYYSKDNLYKEFLEGIVTAPEENSLINFSKLYKEYVAERIGKTSQKGYALKTLITEYIKIYKELLILLPRDIGYGIEDDIESVILSQTSTSFYLKNKFCSFIRYAYARKDIKPLKDFKVIKTKNKISNDDDDIYSPEFYQKLNQYARDVNSHIPRALSSISYANMWVYVLLHLTDVWRHSDIVEKIPRVTLEQIGVFNKGWFEENRMTLEQCQKIINELYIKLQQEVTNKTKSSISFLVEPTLIECLAHALVISEIHRRSNLKDTLLFTFLIRNNALAGIKKEHLSFFNKDPELKVFRNLKMNRSTMTYLHYHIVEEDTDNADVALAFTKQARSHKSNKGNPAASDTTSIYIKAMNKDGSVNRVANNLFERGHFGWLYNYIILLALKDSAKIHSLEERTDAIKILRNDINPKDLEDWAGFLHNNQSLRRNVIQELSSYSEEELVVLIRKLFNQELPSKTPPGQCMVSPNCRYTTRKNCFGCEYFVPQFYVLIEAAKEFKRLIKSMEEANYKATFKRDERLLLTTLAVLNEAKAILPKEQFNSFISSEEIRIGVQGLRNKTFIE